MCGPSLSITSEVRCGPARCPERRSRGTTYCNCIRHQKLLHRWLDIRAFDASETAWLTELASAEVRTKIELPDIINVLIEELVRQAPYELPSLTTLQRIATQARSTLHEASIGPSPTHWMRR